MSIKTSTLLSPPELLFRNRFRREATPDTKQAVRAWLAGFADCVRRRDFEGGKAFFHPRAYCFGSYAEACDGLEDLVASQWKNIWPNITGFAFDMKRLRYKSSSDGLLLCAMVPWRSVGYQHGQAFARNGRLTVVLTRPRSTASWRALHTHYSLTPGTPQTAIPRT